MGVSQVRHPLIIEGQTGRCPEPSAVQDPDDLVVGKFLRKVSYKLDQFRRGCVLRPAGSPLLNLKERHFTPIPVNLGLQL